MRWLAWMNVLAMAATLEMLPSCGSSTPAAPPVDTGGTGGEAPGSGGSGGSAGGAAPYPIGNAIVLDGAVVPIYRTARADAPRALGFVLEAGLLRAVDEQGAQLWQANVGDGSLFGGFDFDADGWPDVGLARSQASGTICGSTPMLTTWLDVVAGKSGQIFEMVGPLDSLCWTFGSATYPTTQWSGLGLLFGEGATLVAFPYYATDGAALAFDGSSFVEQATFAFPSTSQYDTGYLADQPNPYGQPQSYIANSHVANGLIVSHESEERVVFFTSARVVQYASSPYTPDQLLHDTPFLSGGRTDMAGRNYGLVLHDPSDPARVVLVSGTAADTLFEDMRSGRMAADPWGQIERHLTLYDLDSAVVEDRFFSYAHDNNDGNQYEGRVVYPDQPLVGRAAPPSRVAFNVYEGGHWQLHVTAPGSTADAIVFADRFLWDIRDLDLDGTAEWIVSPSRDPDDPDVPGYYFVKWRTVLAHWNDVALELETERTIEGAIPYLAATFRQPTKTSSRGSLYPVLTVGSPRGMELLLWTPNGELLREAL